MNIDELEEHHLAMAVETARQALDCEADGVHWGNVDAEMLCYFVRRTMKIAEAIAEPVIGG